MIRALIAYFADRHLLTNLIFLMVFFGGIVSWQNIKKEELPDVTFDRVRISASYPGATAEEVEHFVTKEIEEAVEGLDGVYRVTSTASQGSTNVTVELEQDYPKKDEAITEIRNAVSAVDLPEDVRDDPSVRVFQTSKKAILDIALIHTKAHLLNVQERQLLQQYAQSLETQLVNLKEVNSVNKSGYYQEEIQIKADPEKLIRYNIPLSQVKREVANNHARMPAGHIDIKNEPKVTINAQLDTPEKLNQLFIQAGFEGQAIPLRDIAEVVPGFDQGKEITKVNGHESVMFNVVKNSSAGILESLDAVTALVDEYRENHLKDVPVDVVLLDDESIDVRNRLSIISLNGAMGFVLILAMLFLFLNKRSGVWVSMGIPFTICFTLIGGWLMGYTVNNTTLAAIIIVMGIVVDDAIVVAENIGRLRSQGMSSKDAAIEGTSQVFLPILASIVTTCVAFIPLFYFQGRFGQINKYIPPIIFLMLGASLFESLLILPGHMHFELPVLKRFTNGGKNKERVLKRHWFEKIEDRYGKILEKILPFKYFVFLGFIILLALSWWLMTAKMKFVMFPNEETRDIVLSGEADKSADRIDTANLTKKIEDILQPYIGKEVVGYRTEIARSRRGGEVQENRFSMVVEIVPKEKRKKSADQLIAVWKPQIEAIEGFKKITFQKSRWGQDSGSPIEILIQENNDQLREQAANKLAELMRAHPHLINVEIEEPIKIAEHKIEFQREKVKRLNINPTDITATFRSALEGSVLYEFPKGDEEVEVRLTVKDESKKDLNTILNIPVENQRNYLVPLRDLVNVQDAQTPNSISRRDGKRTTTIYADIKPKAKRTPLELADEIETTIFPQVMKAQPSTTMDFTGEVFDTREAQGGFRNAIIMVTVLIFVILAVLYNSLTRPLIIMLAIPFGMVGVVLAFWLHGKILFGFYAAIGALGLAGVVINDSIIMLAKLDNDFCAKDRNEINFQISDIAKTRLRAVVLTTLTTVAGVLPTAYGVAGYDAMLAEMMLALAWGLVFGTVITLLLIPCFYSMVQHVHFQVQHMIGNET
ncbi:MAG: efflux RND transporter permease subunit [Candidatus Omnitrophica bacterium]|nr:efflux RND transporter permease subunit [Candidatus Omnitrophota bacterium]